MHSVLCTRPRAMARARYPANMTVTVTTAYSGPFTPNGVATVFGFDFKAASADEVAVVLVETDTTISNGLFTVALDASGEGGTVSFTLPPAAGTSDFLIVSDPGFQQQGTFTGGERPFTPSAINRLLDEGAVRDIALREGVRRAIQLPVGEEAPTLPPRSLRVGGRKKLLAFNQSTGDVQVEEAGATFQGDPGPAGPTFLTLAAFKAAPTSNEKQALKAPGIPDGDFYWRTGDFTGQADDISVIKADSTPLSDGAWKRQEAEGIAAAGAPSAPPLTGRTMQRYIDDDLPPAWFGIVGDGSANDDAGMGFALEFAAELTQAAEPYSPANLTAARIAQPLSFKGKRIRLTQPRVISQRKVDRTNGFLELSDAAYIIDGDFTAFVPDTDAVVGGQPNAEFIAFSKSLFFNANPTNTATCFDERFLRMRFGECQWWQQRCLNTTTAFAQEWQFRDCTARAWPNGQAWFKAAGGYAVRSWGSKFQNGGGDVFEMNSANAGVVDCSHYGFTVESNVGHCGSAWKRDPGSGVIGVEKGPLIPVV